MLDVISQENPNLLEEKVDSILEDKSPNHKTLLVSDADECITCGHLSRELSNRVNCFTGREFPKNVEDDSILNIIRVWENYIGVPYDRFIDLMSQATDQVAISDDFSYIANKHLRSSEIFPVVISSGVKEVIEIALARKNLGYMNLIACEVLVDEYSKKLVRPTLTVGMLEKFYLTTLLMEKGSFERCISVGHSPNDIPLILSGTNGLQFWLKDYRYPEIPKILRKFKVQTLDTYRDIEPYLATYTHKK